MTWNAAQRPPSAALTDGRGDQPTNLFEQLEKQDPGKQIFESINAHLKRRKTVPTQPNKRYKTNELSKDLIHIQGESCKSLKTTFF